MPAGLIRAAVAEGAISIVGVVLIEAVASVVVVIVAALVLIVVAILAVLAVAVEDGLFTPVIRDAEAKSLSKLSKEMKELAEKARSKKLMPNEYQGGSFSISNLGMFGIESFTSIINQPNSAILSIGSIIEKPIVRDGELVVGNTMKLTLACDHRTVDGATGSLFLKTLISIFSFVDVLI